MGPILSQVYDDDLDNLVGIKEIHLSNPRNGDEEEEVEYSSWIIKGKNYVPAPDVKIVKKLPSGVYKVMWADNDYVMSPIPLNTDDLYSFSEDFTSIMLEEVKNFWNQKEKYDKFGLTHRRGILLCGAPGTGKTSLITLLIKQIIEKDGLVFLVSEVQDFNCLFQTIKTVIRRIEPERPIITVFEDVDQLINMMGGDAKLLDFLDGRASVDNCLSILTSNNTSELSEALLRPSRIDLMYEVPMPDERIRGEYFMKKGVKTEDIPKFVEETEGMSFAELKEIFIGTYVLGKPLDKVVQQIKEPMECKDYLDKNKEMKGLI